MRLTTKTRYGTRAMLDLALHAGAGPVCTSEIAERQQVSAKYLEHVLVLLRRAGLVRTRRGARGGHSLSRDPADIDLRQIYEALEGTAGLVECTEDPASCPRHVNCVTRHVWAEMREAALQVLSSTTVADLVARACSGAAQTATTAGRDGDESKLVGRGKAGLRGAT